MRHGSGVLNQADQKCLPGHWSGLVEIRVATLHRGKHMAQLSFRVISKLFIENSQNLIAKDVHKKCEFCSCYGNIPLGVSLTSLVGENCSPLAYQGSCNFASVFWWGNLRLMGCWEQDSPGSLEIT